jgi:hypothetical protein
VGQAGIRKISRADFDAIVRVFRQRGEPAEARTSKSLFSHHYLTHRLPDHPEWRENAGPTLTALRQLYQAQKERLPLYNEDQTEEEFILPLLREVLGFAGAYTVEAGIRRQGRVQRPDYALFANAAQKEEADRHLGDERAFYARAVAVADAKYWQRPLSQKRTDERDAWTNSNPSFQIVNYLVATGVNWGILTNGRLWRLYSAAGLRHGHRILRSRPVRHPATRPRPAGRAAGSVQTLVALLSPGRLCARQPGTQLFTAGAGRQRRLRPRRGRPAQRARLRPDFPPAGRRFCSRQGLARP